MLTEKYDFRITDQMTIPLRPHWIANDSYREKCKMLVLNRSKGEIILPGILSKESKIKVG